MPPNPSIAQARQNRRADLCNTTSTSEPPLPMLVRRNHNNGRTNYLRTAYDVNDGGGLTFAHGTPRAYHYGKSMVTRVEENDRHQLVFHTSQYLPRAMVELLAEKSVSYSSPGGDGSIILCSDVSIDQDVLMDFLGRQDKTGAPPDLPNPQRHGQTKKTPTYIAGAPPSACQVRCFHELEEADHHNWELRQERDSYKALLVTTLSEGKREKTQPTNVDSKGDRNEASGEASECPVSAMPTSQPPIHARSFGTGERNLHETSTPASVLSNSLNVGMDVHAGRPVPVRSIPSSPRSREHLVVKLQIHIEYDVDGRPREPSRRGKRSLPLKNYREADSDEEKKEQMNHDKDGDNCPPKIYTDTRPPEIKLGFVRLADGAKGWQYGLPTSVGLSDRHCEFRRMIIELDELEQQFHPDSTDRQVLDKHDDYLRKQVNRIFEAVGPTLWQGGRPEQSIFIHPRCSLDFKKECDRNVLRDCFHDFVYKKINITRRDTQHLRGLTSAKCERLLVSKRIPKRKREAELV